jgi:hypothetical protein
MDQKKAIDRNMINSRKLRSERLKILDELLKQDSTLPLIADGAVSTNEGKSLFPLELRHELTFISMHGHINYEFRSTSIS